MPLTTTITVHVLDPSTGEYPKGQVIALSEHWEAMVGEIGFDEIDKSFFCEDIEGNLMPDVTHWFQIPKIPELS